MTLASEPMVSPWIMIPLAVVAMVLFAGHTLALQHADVPPVRRKIRSAVNVLGMFTAAAVAYGASIADPANKKAFVLCWLLVVGLVGVSLVLALVDVIVTFKLALRERREDAQRSAEQLAAAVLKARGRGASSPPPQGPAA